MAETAARLVGSAPQAERRQGRIVVDAGPRSQARLRRGERGRARRCRPQDGPGQVADSVARPDLELARRRGRRAPSGRLRRRAARVRRLRPDEAAAGALAGEPRRMHRGDAGGVARPDLRRHSRGRHVRTGLSSACSPVITNPVELMHASGACRPFLGGRWQSSGLKAEQTGARAVHRAVRVPKGSKSAGEGWLSLADWAAARDGPASLRS